MEIKTMTLQTAKLTEMKDFYIKQLGFILIEENDDSFRFAVGSSELEFTSNGVTKIPYYHFAINIPSNKFIEAKTWIKERVSLNLEDGQDEVDFSHLPAHALYFDDPSGNVVEFISRHSMKTDQDKPFSIKSVLNISEIGVTVNDVFSAADALNKVGVTERDNEVINEQTLNFMGDRKTGVFIILNQPGRRWIFSEKLSNTFPLSITLSNNSKIDVNTNGELSTTA
ncbi:VOC family protein [Alkalibacillus haloalkaliphilus]|uniref:VOC family protein n=1 Tax=Alkalibacillus haloalkaliphilus TaxID=94136 RepID=UPI0002E8B990|nr:VOC family protein [Alkalibacillus haloalkaliphilus]